MRAQRIFLIAFFIFAIWSMPTSALEPELNLGQVRESSLRPGEAQSFLIALAEGDFAQIGVKPRGQVLVVKTYDPWASPFVVPK